MDALLTFLFKHPARAWERGELVWSPVLPAWSLAVAAVTVVGVAVWSYGRVQGLSGTRRVALAGLRAALLLLLLVCLARPTLVLARAVPQRNVLAIALDDSRSMALADGGAETRAAATTRIFADSTALVRALADRFALRFYRFAADVRPAAGADGLRMTGTRTDLAGALDGVRQELAGTPIAGIVVVTDGADNAGRELAPALLALRARRIPVYTVGAGLERFPRDVAIERLALPSRPLRGAGLLADVTLRLRGVAGEALTLVAEADGRVVGTQVVTLPPREETMRARIPLTPLDPGPHRITVRAGTLPRETIAENNVAHGVVQVRDGPDRILYVEGEPRPELSFLRRAVAADSALNVVTLLRSAEQKYLRLGVRDSLELAGGFPTRREELFAFRGLILGSIEASFFTADQLRMLAEFVSVRGGGLLALGGRAAFAEGGYRGTPVAEVLPLALDRAPREAEAPPVELDVRPTIAGAAQAALRLAADDSANAIRWDSLPPITVVNALGSLRPGATALLTGRRAGETIDQPVYATQRFGRGTSGVFAPQDSWLWKMDPTTPVEDVTHETLWRQIARALTEESPDRVEVTVVPSHLAPGEPVELRVRVADERYVEVNDAQVVATVTSPSGRETAVPLEWSLAEDGVYRGRFVAEEAGLYAVAAEARRGRDSTRGAPAPLLADEAGADVEQAEQRAPLLRRVATETGGRYYPLAEAGRLVEDVQYTDSGVAVRDALDLWDMPVVFLALAVLLAAEWGLRRGRGLA
ncbi:MAG: hypothetical protein K1X31_06315 [Gemmatimonadaceae bacterium]|nr:hypothetical protein [Gemmatimonadaceae bacterium]